MYFHTLFYPHVFSKNTNYGFRTILPNGPLVSGSLLDKYDKTKDPILAFILNRSIWRKKYIKIR